MDCWRWISKLELLVRWTHRLWRSQDRVCFLIRGSPCLSTSHRSESLLRSLPHTCASFVLFNLHSGLAAAALWLFFSCPYTRFSTSPYKCPPAACSAARHWVEVEDRVLSSYWMTLMVSFGGFQMDGDPLNDHTFSDTHWQSLDPVGKHHLISRVDTPNFDSCVFLGAFTLVSLCCLYKVCVPYILREERFMEVS